MIANKINGKQTKLTWNGVKYKASVVGDQPSDCHGCAFYGPRAMGCPSVPHKVGQTPYCTRGTRLDGQTIVWVKRKKQPVQGE